MDETALKEAKLEANHLFSLTLNPKQLSDVELILDGSFKPLEGFLNQRDYNRYF